MTRSPELSRILVYVGSKRALAPRLIKAFPRHETWVDLFGGGGHVTFAKPPAKREVLNDLDRNLIGFYRKFSCKRVAACARIRNVCEFSKGARARIRKGSSDVCDQILSRRFSIVGDVYGGMKTTECAVSNPVSSKLIKECPELERRLRHLKLENLDFRKAFRKYDSPTTLTFIDPPYPKTTAPSKHKAEGAPPAEVCELARKAKGHVMITYNDIPAVRKACHGLEMRSIPSTHTSKNVTHGASKTRELVIANFKLPSRI